MNLGENTSHLYTEDVANQSATLKNILSNTDKDEQEARLISRKMKKEQERLAKKFKIISPAEFEASLNQPTNMAQSGRAHENDSWCNNVATNANTTVANDSVNAIVYQGKNEAAQNQ